MKLRKVIIHNFRSVLDATFEVSNYSLIVGENNSGKTNLLSALRVFYEDGGLKFDKNRDFPKIDTTDNESWIELHFHTSDEEQDSLKDDYKSSDNILKVRKYFLSDEGRVKAKQSNIYAYENGALSENNFYGAANVSSSKLGSIIYIPAVSKVEDTLKTSGPSPFRDLVNLVMKKVVASSNVFDELNNAFSKFNNEFKGEEASGLSIDGIKSGVNAELSQWGVGIDIEVSPIKSDDIVKNLLKPHIEDHKLNGQRVDISSFGQGLQRHLIYTLIKMSSQYNAPSKSSKKDFNPDYTLLLFEEPEAFLHPSQQDVLFRSLKELGDADGQQVIVSTHSSQFVGKSVSDLTSILRLHRSDKHSVAHQLTEATMQEVLDNNLVAAREFGEDQDPNFDEEVRMADEELRYFLWLDSERSSLFFARHVLLCEGASEKIYFDYLADNEWGFLRESRVYVLDCLGKYNLHRFIHLLTELGIPHSVVFDGDNNRGHHSAWNGIVTDASTPLTSGIHQFTEDLEEFLGIPKPQGRNDLKPINIIKHHVDGLIDDQKKSDLETIVKGLVGV
ncbi:ATP-dependent nuclease [Pseudoalteromonas rubra]|uniref:ATP-dependent endonuclease n=1 Tax=Pseudoalteromonas rubra TaxID=43658 RepID=A0A0U3IEJ2_9GAMM|nr:AAA family ATPase [Pseudoalteromonas rubra]ALU41820.1 ATP-dependent endonuclease [Pseudoalteromonas rubra]